jgi:uncharacterized membrane protein HdeD (DUF308 family)
VAVGVVVLTWPQATVLALSLLLGTQVLASGLLVSIAAFVGPRSHA